jgi:hypothetical protein
MYGDTEVIRRQVSRLRDQGADIRLMADQLVARTEGIAWSGRAADTMRERMRDRADRLRDAAARHDTAAESLERHVVEVDTAKDAILATERRATAIVADARTRVAAVAARSELDGGLDGGLDGAPGVRRQADPLDEELAAFTPPGTGHKDWLHVDLPGL